MRKKTVLLMLLAALSLLLSGCMLKTVDQLYSLPKRSEEYQDLQTAIDSVMTGLDYCAPIQGDNQQTVQLADLDGDGEQEAILFAKGTDERPLKILVFFRTEDGYSAIAPIETAGTAFEQVEYAEMDGKPGVELIVGRQLGGEVLHSLSVYNFSGQKSETALTAGYTRFLTADLDRDDLRELFVLRPGSDTGNGVAELYAYRDGILERAGEAPLSEPVDRLKRVVFGGMTGALQAVFVASDYTQDAIITDVFAVIGRRFINVSLSNDSGTSIQTVRNYYVYVDDIDKDGLIELPSPVDPDSAGKQEMLRWYNLMPDGTEAEKAFTYHNYSDRWYVTLREEWMGTINVSRRNDVGNTQGYVFSMGAGGTVLFTIYAFTGNDRDRQAVIDGRFPLNSTAEVVYAAVLGPGAEANGVTRDSLISDFNFIREAWKTGEM